MSDILSRLSPPPGSRTKRKRVGRGPGSGLGKTSGKGGKGQTARAGRKPGRGFEGGQMPVQRRLPKRGFTNPFRKDIVSVNVGRLDVFEAGAVVDPEALIARGLIRRVGDGVKILGKGDLKKKLKIRAHFISAGAREKIEKAGGSYEEIMQRR
ncbi:MAG: 50S ribosomal protein L15 [Deltaproteobacteria bacterium]|nr:50S ribosomal protein L15 [Deltaproteobacteria bacterium]